MLRGTWERLVISSSSSCLLFRSNPIILVAGPMFVMQGCSSLSPVADIGEKWLRSSILHSTGETITSSSSARLRHLRHHPRGQCTYVEDMSAKCMKV